MATLLRDLRYAFRTLVKSPLFSVIAILTLALGVGANSAIFSVVNAVVLRPLPYPRSERLVEIYTQFPAQGFDRFWLSAPEFLDLQAQARSYESVGAYTVTGAPVLGGEMPVRAVTAYCTPSLLPTIGQEPKLGRFFLPEEDLPDAPQAVLLGHGLWQRIFGGDPNIIGRTIRVDSGMVRVVGVMPEGFNFPGEGVELWVPADLRESQSRGGHAWNVIGRLREGVTPAAARGELDSLMASWAGRFKHSINKGDHPIVLHPLMGEIVGAIRTPLLVLQGAVFLVLLIACANVSSLLLARAEARSREISIRVALGAGRRRLAQQLLTESAVLGILGGALGLLLAAWGLDFMLALVPENAPRMSEVRIDGAVLLFTIASSIVTTLVFGLAPIVHVQGPAFQQAWSQAGQRSTGGLTRNRFRRGLVVAEMALAVVLVVGSGLMIRSYERVVHVDPGISPHGLLTFQIELPEKEYPDNQVATNLWLEILRRLRALPGVSAATVANGLPPNRRLMANDIVFEGMTPAKDGPPWNVDFFQTIDSDYLATMGIAVMRGRGFAASDGPDGQPVALVNETFARRFFPGQEAVGHRVRVGPETVPPITIVGVVKDVKQQGLEAPTGTEIYFSMRQTQGLLERANRFMNIIVRVETGDPRSLEPTVRRAVGEIDSTLAIAKLATMDQLMYEAVAKPRFVTMLLGILAGLAMALAAIGVYGIMSYSVAQRTHELGIRMALGAEPARVRGMVVGQGLRLAAIGIALGLGAAVLVNYVLYRALTEMLFETGAFDPSTFLGVMALMVGVAGVASYAPARRATRVSPMIALRDA